MTSEPPGAPVADARARRSAADWAKIAFLLLALGFGAWFIASRWSALSNVVSRLSWLTLIGSIALGAVGTFLGGLGWRAVLADLGAPLPLAAATRVFFVGQLGKYLPGSVWSFIGQAELAKSHHASRKTALAGSVLGAGLSIAVGLVLALVLLPFGAHAALAHYWWVVLAVPAFALLLHPRISGPLIDRALRLIRRQPLDRHPSYAGTMRAAGWYAAGWIVLGLHAWVLAVGLGAPALRSLAVVVGGFLLAFCLGTLFIPAPAGAGIRDVALVIALHPVLDHNEALAVALASRVILAILDFALAGGASLWSRHADRMQSVVDLNLDGAAPVRRASAPEGRGDHQR